MTTDNIIRRKIRGSILGGAIGDAMGGPLEVRPEGFAEKFYGGPVEELQLYYDRETNELMADRPKGDYTDDTRLKNLLCAAIIEHEGRVTAEQFAKTLADRMNPDDYWFSEKIAYYKLKYKVRFGRLTARELGGGNIPACDADMMISPVGLINACNPRQAALDAFEVASVLQSGCSATSACAIAAAVARAMDPSAKLNDVIRAAVASTDAGTAAAIGKSVGLAEGAADFGAFKSSFYGELLTVHIDPIEVTCAVFGIIAAVDGDLRQGIIQGANFGRDCDTIASIVGSILGALHGDTPLEQSWIADLERANPEPDLERIVEKLYQALRKEVGRQKSYTQKMEALFGA